MLNLFLAGIPPSKKNSHQRWSYKNKAGKTVNIISPSKEYRDWEKKSAALLMCQAREQRVFGSLKFSASVRLIYQVYDKRGWDLTNKAEGIMDSLVESKILFDDNRFYVPELTISWIQVLKEMEGTTIEICAFKDNKIIVPRGTIEEQ